MTDEDFTKSLKVAAHATAVGDGEDYITKYYDGTRLVYAFPAIHRRHKIAWAFWRKATNEQLLRGDASGMTRLQEWCEVPAPYDKWKKKELTDSRKNGTYLRPLSKEFYNNPANIWLGPSDENIAKGVKIPGALKAVTAKGVASKKKRQRLEEAAIDLQRLEEFDFDPPEPATGKEGEWTGKKRPMSPTSKRIKKNAPNIIDQLNKLTK